MAYYSSRYDWFVLNQKQYDWDDTGKRGEEIFQKITDLPRHPNRCYDFFFMGFDGQPLSLKSAVFSQRSPCIVRPGD
jgi:hypothetical protein